MENMDLQSNLTVMENIEFEEKVNINNLLLPSKPIKLAKIEIHDIKQEPLLVEKHYFDFESDLDVGKKMKENISKLYQEFVENIEQYDSVNRQMLSEIVSLKAKIVEMTDEHKITMCLNSETMAKKINELAENKQELQSIKAINEELLQKNQELLAMSTNAETMNCIVKGHEKVIESKTNELASIKQELKRSNIINQELLEKIQINSTDTLKELGDCSEQACTAFCEPSLVENEDKKGKKGMRKTMFKCSECDMGFYEEHCLKRHVKTVHEGKISCQCTEFDVEFKSKTGLKMHKESISKGLKHECPKCDKSF